MSDDDRKELDAIREAVAALRERIERIARLVGEEDS